MLNDLKGQLGAGVVWVRLHTQPAAGQLPLSNLALYRFKHVSVALAKLGGLSCPAPALVACGCSAGSAGCRFFTMKNCSSEASNPPFESFIRLTSTENSYRRPSLGLIQYRHRSNRTARWDPQPRLTPSSGAPSSVARSTAIAAQAAYRGAVAGLLVLCNRRRPCRRRPCAPPQSSC